MKNKLGQKGETKAAQFLKQKGYRILAQNWTHAHLEVDIIAQDKDMLVIVEVKSRKSDLYGNPSQAVNHKKQLNLYRAANKFIHAKDYKGEVRFDIIAVYLEKNEWIIEHYIDAFYPY